MVSVPALDPSIDAAHRRIDSDRWDDIYVVGDVRGCRATLEETADGRTPVEQWHDVHDALGPMLETQADCYSEMLRPALSAAGIDVLDYEELDGDRRYLKTKTGTRDALRRYYD
ncbi:hypothetical protein [Haloarcula amylovorans]|uniref:hypothetical protein n=1 Tax=Haloarcula amylovorans TaxID=2562280 RepID=UPI001ADDDB3F|nr:hypothetical protein [Halomicroarcula amylolytica]